MRRSEIKYDQQPLAPNNHQGYEQPQRKQGCVDQAPEPTVHNLSDRINQEIKWPVKQTLPLSIPLSLIPRLLCTCSCVDDTETKGYLA